MSRNHLDQETSPYLLQHAANPVHWRPWGPAALAEAREQDKPILLSVGYAACHWCHVMAHESFEDAAVAELMNRLYVPIKVDREERPDLDIIYQSALAALGQQGGWPLTMFLTPAGEPFWGGTYYPPTARYGRPSFPDVLTGVSEVYRRQPDKVTGNVGALLDALARQSTAEPGPAPTPELLDNAAQAVLRLVDPVHGGLSGAPKFPHLPLFTLLWRAGLRSGETALGDATLLTLRRMTRGGIYDQLGGGYARYATDEAWLVPHFEKMLYDNAQMIDLLTLVWQTTRTDLFARAVAETIGWLGREMLAEHDAFAATLDADSEGHEGKYYVWRAEEIDRLLPPDLAALARRTYAVTSAGNWEGVSILERNHPAGELGPEDQARLDEARALLLAHRRTRVPPGRDDKVLADWNGMAIAAVANAAFVFDRPDWLAMAERAFTAIRRHLSDGPRLAHSLCRGRRQAGGILDDYAQMARAALILHEVTGDGDYLDQARAWVASLDAHYLDHQAGGYFFTADDATDLILRTRSAHDHPTPSGNAVMIEVLARLYHLTGGVDYRARADAVIAAFAGDLGQAFTGMGSFLNACEYLDDALQVVIVGRPEDAAHRRLVRVVADTGLPTRLLQLLRPGQALPPGHPAAAKLAAAAAGAPLAFVCRGAVCQPPVSEPSALQTALVAR